MPVLVGDPRPRRKLASDMHCCRTIGVYVQPINYPTVPKGTERLRAFTPTRPSMTTAWFDHLVKAMDELWTRFANVESVWAAWPLNVSHKDYFSACLGLGYWMRAASGRGRLALLQFTTAQRAG